MTPIAAPMGRGTLWEHVETSRPTLACMAAWLHFVWALAALVLPIVGQLELGFWFLILPMASQGAGVVAALSLSRRVGYWAGAGAWSAMLAMRFFLLGKGAVWAGLLVALLPLVIAYASERPLLRWALSGQASYHPAAVIDERLWHPKPLPERLYVANPLSPVMEPPHESLLEHWQRLGIPPDPSSVAIEAAFARKKAELESRKAVLPRKEYIDTKLALERAREALLRKPAKDPGPESLKRAPDGQALWREAMASKDRNAKIRALRVLFYQKPALLTVLAGADPEVLKAALQEEDSSALGLWGLGSKPEPPKPSVKPPTPPTRPAAASYPKVPLTPPKPPATPPREVSKPTFYALAVVGHRTSRKFHGPGCPYGDKIGARNRVRFASRDEAVRSGFIPCGVCYGKPY